MNLDQEKPPSTSSRPPPKKPIRLGPLLFWVGSYLAVAGYIAMRWPPMPEPIPGYHCGLPVLGVLMLKLWALASATAVWVFSYLFRYVI